MTFINRYSTNNPWEYWGIGAEETPVDQTITQKTVRSGAMSAQALPHPVIEINERRDTEVTNPRSPPLNAPFDENERKGTNVTHYSHCSSDPTFAPPYRSSDPFEVDDRKNTASTVQDDYPLYDPFEEEENDKKAFIAFELHEKMMLERRAELLLKYTEALPEFEKLHGQIDDLLEDPIFDDSFLEQWWEKCNDTRKKAYENLISYESVIKKFLLSVNSPTKEIQEMTNQLKLLLDQYSKIFYSFNSKANLVFPPEDT